MMFVNRDTFDEIYRKLLAGELDTKDVHTAVAAHVLKLHPRDVTPEQRQAAKTANFIHLYSNTITKTREV